MNTARPLVTIITPCFNHAQYLHDYFRGLLAQTYDHVELFFFDDGSSDDSWKIACEYVPALERKFTRVVAERHDHIGAVEELLLALEQMEGELLCVLESDDYYLPTRLEENVGYLVQHPHAGAVHSDADFLYPEGIERRHLRRTRGHVPSGDIYAELLERNFILTCAFCCRTDLFRRYVSLPEYMRRGYLAGDYAWSLDLAKRAPIGYIEKSLARYRVVEGSWSHARTRRGYFRFHRSIYAMKLDYLDDPRVSPDVATRVQSQYFQIVYQQGVELAQPDECDEGYGWLRANVPEKYDRAHHRIAVRLVHLRLWRFAELLGAVPLLLRGFWRLKRLRDHRAFRKALEPYGGYEPGREPRHAVEHTHGLDVAT